MNKPTLHIEQGRNSKVLAQGLIFPMALIAAMCTSGVAMAKQGADDPAGHQSHSADDTTTQPPTTTVTDDKGGTNPTPTATDDKGGTNKTPTATDDKGGANNTPTPTDDKGGANPTPTATDDKGGQNHDGSDDQGVNSGRSVKKLRLGLVAGDISTNPALVKLEYKVKKGLAEFKAGLKLALPSTATGIVDQTTAEDAVITATLSNGGVAYAECTFGFDRVKPKTAQFAIALKEVSRKGTVSVRQNKGSCDIDLATDGVQAGMPLVTQGDLAVIEFQPADPGAAPIELGRGNF